MADDLTEQIADVARRELSNPEEMGPVVAGVVAIVGPELEGMEGVVTDLGVVRLELQAEVERLRIERDKARILAGLRGDLLHECRQKLDAAQRAGREAEAERDLAIAHDRQPYPTAWAYEQACKALETQRQRAELAEDRLDGQAWDDLTARAEKAESERMAEARCAVSLRREVERLQREQHVWQAEWSRVLAERDAVKAATERVRALIEREKASSSAYALFDTGAVVVDGFDLDELAASLDPTDTADGGLTVRPDDVVVIRTTPDAEPIVVHGRDIAVVHPTDTNGAST